MERSDHIRELFQKYKGNTCTPEELDELLEAFKLNSNEFLLRAIIREEQLAEAVFGEDEHAMEIADNVEARLFREIAQQSNVTERKQAKRMGWYQLAIAASVVFCLSISGYFLLRNTQSRQISQIPKQDIVPGGNKAVLTLANGQRIILTDAKNGLLSSQGSTKVNKTADGQVVYEDTQSPSTVISYNTMTTPRGGQYHLTLTDGTNVWLNAASSIKYPVTFNGKYRQVEITGEAYFEVAHNHTKPFRVISSGQIVEVLGTHFNINAYNDEPFVKTVLLEGSVKVSDLTSHQTKLLKPNQQAILNHNGLVAGNADVEETMAWKNNYFRFHDEDIESIMRRIARWYDIQVKFEGHISDNQFNGKISKFKNIGQVLRMLEETNGVHFKVSGKEVTVMQ